MKTYAAVGGVGALVIITILAIYALVVAIGAAVLSWAWNLVVPSTFNGPTLEFFPAVALIVVFIVIRSFLLDGGTKA